MNGILFLNSAKCLILGLLCTNLLETCSFITSANPALKLENTSKRTTTPCSLYAKIRETEQEPDAINRSSFFQKMSVSLLTALIPSTLSVGNSFALQALEEKLTNLSNDQIAKIVMSDMVDKSFLVTALISREIYDESATFTDEIDTYTLDKWVKGTQRLFVSEGSNVQLEGDVNATDLEVTFRFKEDLMFNIPFKPVVSLSGRVVLKRDENSGLITSYREFWDQDVGAVLKSAKF